MGKKYRMEKRITTMGNSMGIYISKSLGFVPGDLVSVTIEMSQPVSRDAIEEAREMSE